MVMVMFTWEILFLVTRSVCRSLLYSVFQPACVNMPQYTSSIWGPTCDGLDCIMEQVFLPELGIGDWMIFPDMGAYSISIASTFNGMPKSRVYYTAQEFYW